MQAFGIVVIGVLIVGVVLGLYAARNPPHWDDLGGGSPLGDATQPTRMDDEADLRALVAEKRARRLAGGGPAVASDARAAAATEAAQAEAAGAGTDAAAGPWAHLDDEVVQEARDLVARRRARLIRDGREPADEQAELERLLGPP